VERSVRNRWIEASARNTADWQDASLRALGIETCRTDGLWSREAMRPSIYLNALTLSSVRAEPGVVRSIERLIERDPHATISLWDSFKELDLTGLGFRRMDWVGEWWMKDAATRPDEPMPLGLDIELVKDEETLGEFGLASYDGFETADPVRAAGPLGMHHPSTLDDPRMRYLAGRADGRIVTSAIAYVGNDVVGIYAVSTLPAYRRRGYGKAITRAAAMSAPELGVTISPDVVARGIDTELGFRKIAEYTPWLRAPPRP